MSGFDYWGVFLVVVSIAYVGILGVILVRGTRAGRFRVNSALPADRATHPIYFHAAQVRLLCIALVIPALVLLLHSDTRVGEPFSYPFLVSFGLMLFLTGGILAYWTVMGFKIGECIANRDARLRLNSNRRTHPVTFWVLQAFMAAVSVILTLLGGLVGFGTIAILIRSGLGGD